MQSSPEHLNNVTNISISCYIRLSVGQSISNQLVKINTNQWNYMKLYENKWKSMQSSPETLNKVINISTNCFIHLSVSLSISNQLVKFNPNQ